MRIGDEKHHRDDKIGPKELIQPHEKELAFARMTQSQAQSCKLS